ncbi:MAG: DUF362 domain-containing protein [Labilithrix sp.]|nr:DUF362 domain-containing protein [Labilithrix sp.]MCW5815915.1 DUF362 domain-containing protein [Labilithrix sp.]
MNEKESRALVERELSWPNPHLGRRTFLGGAAAAAAAVTTLTSSTADAKDAKDAKSLAAAPPEGFSPFNAPGKVVKVTKAGCLEANKMYPKADDAKEMLTKALTELTGKPDLVSAVKEFVHPDDVIVVKVNGIAQKQFATNKELVIPFVEAMVTAGMKPENITLLEQWHGYFAATRITAQNVPSGVKILTHSNGNATMAERPIPGTGGVKTQFTRYLTEATACINFALVKHHSICGYTGAMKNMTHGCSVNPEAFHAHHASPQIALMYAQDVIKSRVRLNIADAFKTMCEGGPLGKTPQFHKVYESVFASTDPVAIDAIGWEVIEKHRADFKLKPLVDQGQEPYYIKIGQDLGLGIADRARIQLKEFTV